VTNWIWVAPDVVLALHEEHLAEHGGHAGVRDDGLLASALDRPRDKAAYDPEVDAAGLAAAYAFGIARNHPFVDGNKRTAFVAARLFLDLNGFEYEAEEAESLIVFLALAAGEIGEKALADWLRKKIRAKR
jgi:death-on-curing protein